MLRYSQSPQTISPEQNPSQIRPIKTKELRRSSRTKKRHRHFRKFIRKMYAHNRQNVPITKRRQYNPSIHPSPSEENYRKSSNH